MKISVECYLEIAPAKKIRKTKGKLSKYIDFLGYTIYNIHGNRVTHKYNIIV